MSELTWIDAGEQPKKMTVDFVVIYSDTGEEIIRFWMCGPERLRSPVRTTVTR